MMQDIEKSKIYERAKQLADTNTEESLEKSHAAVSVNSGMGGNVRKSWDWNRSLRNL